MFKRIYLAFAILFSGGNCHYKINYRLKNGMHIPEWDSQAVAREVKIEFLFDD